MPSYEFPARFESLDKIRNVVATIARSGGFSEKAIYSLQLAADEAATNIIEHAYGGASGAFLSVTCDLKKDEITITMRDTGKAFDFDSVKTPNVKAKLSKRPIGGLGVYLIRQLMDTVRYESFNSGNVLTMTKRKE
ncbi:MAG: ATP-binding protein [Anaerolineales bacterium]|nr:ATP-binding protein [Anaerolineales bacterium]